LGTSRIAGCLTEHGGWTSHAFILAREFGIPAVTGIPNVLRLLGNEQTVLIDGFRGEVILSPTAATLEKRANGTKQMPAAEPAEKIKDISSIKTIDGHLIKIRVNGDNVKSVKKALQLGASGIGLFRTESLINRYNGFPTENQQVEAISKLGKAAGNSGIKVRTFDVGARQFEINLGVREKNPALGLRGIRLALEEKEHLRTQFRSILRASATCKVDVILPMVAGIQEIRESRSLFEEERSQLLKTGAKVGEVKFGVMIEVPSAVLIVAEIFEEVDFVCLGTNDLVQYLLAVDRDNESVADWFRTLHPAVIRAVSQVLDAGTKAAKPVVICGEMAGSPFYTPLLIGLGASDFSMNLNSIERVRNLVRGIAYEEALNLAVQVRSLRTADEIEDLIMENIERKWTHLFPSEFLSLRKI
jgi:phosphotransferase system enzyme I (PtsI)